MTLDLEHSTDFERASEGAAAPRPLHATVVDRLRDMIVQGELAPGTKLNERVRTAL